MAIITLTTDFGTKDHFVASIKGSILQVNPSAQIIDISHNISPFNLNEAAYVLRNAYPYFPKGSIHLIGVDALSALNQRHLLAEVNGHYFICNDNGILSLVFPNQKLKRVVEFVDQEEKTADVKFVSRDLFAQKAAYFSLNPKMEEQGKITTDYKIRQTLKPQIKDNQIMGSVIYIDNFGNAITNITKELFVSHVKEQAFTIYVRNITFDKIHELYADIVTKKDQEEDFHGKGLCLFNSGGNLEIAIYKSNPDIGGSASSLYGLSIGDNISLNINT